MSDKLELQHQSELADARLSVAENLGWSMSILGATIAHLIWENWFLTIPILVAVISLSHSSTAVKQQMQKIHTIELRALANMQCKK